MTFETPGVAISSVEVTNIGLYGFWLYVDGREYFVPFADYPVFKSATIGQILAVPQNSLLT